LPQFISFAPTPGKFIIDTLAESDLISQLLVEVDCTSRTNQNLCQSAIDPTIRIDPSFLDASEFTLTESTGSTSGVHEPSAIILLGKRGVGFGERATRRPDLFLKENI